MTKIVSWNVNSIRVRMPHISELVHSVKPDVMLLQETKSTDENFPTEEIKNLGYEVLIHGQKSYNGVAILSKIPFELIANELPGDKKDTQARFIEARILTTNPFNVASIYLPNGNPIDTEKFPYKLSWMKRLKKYAELKMKHHETIIFGGDYNIIPKKGDAVDIEKWKNDALHHEKSLKLFREIVNLGLTDVFRVFNSRDYEFTYWDYSRGSWEKDNGLRIDHFLATPLAIDRINDCQIEKKFRALERPSDHVPIWFEID